MKIMIYVASLIFFNGCNSDNISSINEHQRSSQHIIKDCEEPENPYSEGSGHFAGWRWAEENNASNCGGKSASFIEGCERFIEDYDRFTECENR